MEQHILKTFVIVVFFTVWTVRTDAANILGVFPVYSKAHLMVHMSIIRALLERGHNITVVTVLPLKYKSPNLHHVYIPPSDRRVQQIVYRKSEMAKAGNKFQMMVSSLNVLMAMGPSQLDALKHPTFQDFMNNPHNKFDLLVVGYLFNDYLFGIGVHFKCPIVISWTSSSNIFVGRHIGNPLELAYVSPSIIMGLSDPLKFTGRLTKFISSMGASIMIAVLHMQMSILYNEIFPSPQYPSMDEAGKKVSLLLCNSHFTEGNIRPNVPAHVEIGGIQIKEKPDPLPKDLQHIMDRATEHGVIYVSFGSNIGSNELKSETVKILYKTLSTVKQTVLWNWDSKESPGRSPNIHYRQWFPQDDLLAHPNLRLFVTHAGKGSVSESQYHGVPMVAIPIFADQPGNADQLSNDGFGVQVDIFTMTEKTLTSAITEVLENNTYRENVKNFSELYKDRPMTARQTAVYWIEYVIRRKGAYHMQSPLVHLNSLQYMCIDILAFLFAVIFAVLKLIQIVFKSFKILVRKMRRRMSGGSKKLKKN